ncbi:MAX gene-associated protein isoform X2 [Astyanax mexicanus]|uniref:MAX gene-associated protein isoform X2 n=1 Tax=Astyanax mexicanus TaxID=7994 RepID=UPI0020CAD124|nr:MAX gene-associated protein isoform X2 [Astyanax mexicanus]
MEVDVNAERLTGMSCSISTPTSVSDLLMQGQMDDCSNNKTVSGSKQASQPVVLPLVTYSKSPTQNGCTDSNITAVLENETVWSRFHNLGTEMILTKQGRRMFPCCRFRLSGLDLDRKYMLVMDFTPLDDLTHKWNGSTWEPAAVAEPHLPSQVCVHPESPAIGQQWMEGPVSFYKVKLASNPIDEEGSVFLQPMQRYQPRLHVVPVDSDSQEVFDLDSPKVQMFTFPKTEFYAVTSYQNPQITQLKIDCNPFAMAFRKDSQSLRLLQDKLGMCPPGSTPTQLSDQNLTSFNSDRNRKQSTLKEALSPWIKEHSESSYPEDGPGILANLKPAALSHLNGAVLSKKAVDSGENDEPSLTTPALDEQVTLSTVQHSVKTSIQEPPQAINGTVSPMSTTESAKLLCEDAVHSQISNLLHTEPVTNAPVFLSQGRMKLKSAVASFVKTPFRHNIPLHLRRRPKARKPKNKWWTNVRYSRRNPVCATPQRATPNVTLQPDLEDVEGMLFVSFTAKEALDIHVENMEHIETCTSPLPETPKHSDTSQIEEVMISVEERISQLESTLLIHLKQQKHRQVIHPHLQEVGMKLSLLDPKISIDLQYLGVRLPFPSNSYIEINSSATFLDGGGSFVSRTGKTNDPTKIKGWREKFNKKTVQGTSEGMRNNSAFCSDMLDEYLENEAQQISDRAAVLSQGSSTPVSYQLPSKGSSYVVTLNSLLKSRSTSLNKVQYSRVNNSQNKPVVWRAPKKWSSFYSKGPQQTTFENKRSNFAHSCQIDQARSFPDPPSKLGTKNQAINPNLRWSYSSTHAKMQTQSVLQDMEEEALSLGKVRTHITTERASFALNSLLTFQKSGVRPKYYIRHHETECPEEFCRLGCICDSLHREIRGPTHCRRVQCMFDCHCFKHKVLLIRPPKVTTLHQGRKRALMAFPIADPERGDRPPPATSITTLWNKSTPEHDPEPLFVPNPALSFRAAPGMRNYVPRLIPQLREEDKDPVYLYFESRMTCARVREYNSNPPPQVHMLPGKRTREKQTDKVNDCFEAGVAPTSQNRSDISATETVELREAAPTAVGPDEPVPTKLLEILSECNWEPHRNLVLSGLFGRMSNNLLSEPFCLGTYKIQLLSTTLEKGDNPTITYKVCVSRAPEMNVTSDVQPAMKKRTKSNVSKAREKQTQTKTGTTVSAPVASEKKSSLLIDNQARVPTFKKPSRIFPLLSHSLPAGCLKAAKKKAEGSALGLIKVNGKTYNQAKLSLGQMGALHPANRVAAYVTGRLQASRNQWKVKADAPKPHVNQAPVVLRKVMGTAKPIPPASQQSLPAGTSELNTTVLTRTRKSKVTPLDALSKLVVDSTSLQEDASVISPAATTLVVSASPTFVHPTVPPSSAASTSSTKAAMPTLPSGQQVVLQHLPGVPGSNFLCQYNGQLLQLVSVAQGPVGQPQASSMEGGGSQLTSLPKDTNSLQKPLGSTLAKPSLMSFPVIAPKIISLSGSSGMNIASGTPAINLQSRFPGKAGTFSFRICPPSTESKPAGSQQGPKLPDPHVTAPSALILPGGFTLIKLPLQSHPGVPAVSADASSSVSGSAELAQKDQCGEQVAAQSCSLSTEQTCQVSESSSKPSVAETWNNDSTQTDATGLGQGNSVLPSESVKEDKIVHKTLDSVNVSDKTECGNCDVVPEASGMMSKSEHDKEKQAGQATASSSVSSIAIVTSNKDSTQADAGDLNNDNRALTSTVEGQDDKDQLVEKPLVDAVEANNSTAGGKYDWVPEEAEMILRSEPGSEHEEDLDDWSSKGAERVLWIEEDSADEETETFSIEQNCNVANVKSPAGIKGHENEKNEQESSIDVSLDLLKHPNPLSVTSCNISSGSPAHIQTEPSKEPENKDMVVNQPNINDQGLFPKNNSPAVSKEESNSTVTQAHVVSNDLHVKKQGPESDLTSGNLVNEQDPSPKNILPISGENETSKNAPVTEINQPVHSQPKLCSEKSPQVLNNEEQSNQLGQTESFIYTSINITNDNDDDGVDDEEDEDVDIDGDAPVPLLAGQTPAIFTPPVAPLSNTGLENLKSYHEVHSKLDKQSDNSVRISKRVHHFEREDGDETDKKMLKKRRTFPQQKEPHPDSDSNEDDLSSGDDKDSIIDLVSSSSSETTEDSAKLSSEEDDAVDIDAFEENLHKRRFRTSKDGVARYRNSGETDQDMNKRTDASNRLDDLQVIDLERPLTHSEKERVRRGELRLSFASLKAALNIDEPIKMCKHDILIQAHLMIQALKDRKQNLEERKQALLQKQSSYISRIAQLSGKSEEIVERNFKENCELSTVPASVKSSQINPRRLDSDGNRLPPRLGLWRSNNYIRKRSEQSFGHRGRRRKIFKEISEDDSEEAEHVDDQNMEPISVQSPQINPGRLDSEGTQLAPRLVPWKSNNDVGKRSTKSAEPSVTDAADESSNAALPGRHLNGSSPSVRPGDIVLKLMAEKPNILPLIPSSKKPSAERRPSETGPLTGTGMLPKIVLYSFSNADPKKLETAPLPSCFPAFKSAEASPNIVDLTEDDPGIESSDSSLILCKEADNVSVSEESNEENPDCSSLVSECMTESKTLPQLEQKKQDTPEVVNVERRRSARQMERLRSRSAAFSSESESKEKKKKVIWMRCGGFG